jgi:hypothetical protein
MNWCSKSYGPRCLRWRDFVTWDFLDLFACGGKNKLMPWRCGKQGKNEFEEKSR